MGLEYRVLELNINGSKVVSNKFDFGCCILAQDALEVSKTVEEKNKQGKFAFNLVMSILYRMLENKVVKFSDVESMSPETIIDLFNVFMNWFQEDLDYLNEAMSALDSGSTGSADGDVLHRQLSYIGYTLFKNFHVQPKDYKAWDMRDVVDILYCSGYDSALAEVKDKNYI